MLTDNLTLVARKLTKMRFCPCVREHEFVGIPKNKQESFKNAVQQIDWDHILLGIDCEKDSETLLTTIEKTIKDFSSKINYKHNKNLLPWINSDILKLMKERDLALKNAIKSKSTSARNLFTTLRNKVVKNIRKAKADFFLTNLEPTKKTDRSKYKKKKKI